jgi:hypothetical protein
MTYEKEMKIKKHNISKEGFEVEGLGKDLHSIR